MNKNYTNFVKNGTMIPDKTEIARMLDISAVQAQHTLQNVAEMADFAIRNNCIAIFTLPSMTEYAVELLSEYPQTGVGGVAGFPAGGNSTAIKTAEAEELVRLGCNEIDMVINIGMLKSGNYKFVEQDIRQVASAAGPLPLKVILECHYLTNTEIYDASRICVNSGAAFVKTGTGWAPTGATEENITIMKSAVGDDAQVKAAGGIRDLETLVRLYRLGATRFGVGVNSAAKILGEITSQPISADY